MQMQMFDMKNSLSDAPLISESELEKSMGR